LEAYKAVDPLHYPHASSNPEDWLTPWQASVDFPVVLHWVYLLRQIGFSKSSATGENKGPDERLSIKRRPIGPIDQWKKSGWLD
jgi:hypothetical protein